MYARLLTVQSLLIAQLGAWEQSRWAAETALAILRGLDDPAGLAEALIALGGAEHDEGLLDAAHGHVAEALGLYRGQDDIHGMLLALNLLAGIIWDLEGPAAARRRYEEAAALAQRHNLDYERALMLTNVGLTAAMQHDRTGVQALAEALARLSRLGNLRLVAFCLEGLGAFAGLAGHHEDGVRVLSAAARLRERINAPTTPVNYSFQEILTAAARGPLDDERFAAAWRAGQGLSLEEAIGLAQGRA